MLDRCTITLGCGRVTVGEYGVARSSLVSVSRIDRRYTYWRGYV